MYLMFIRAHSLLGWYRRKFYEGNNILVKFFPVGRNHDVYKHLHVEKVY